jgi:UDP-N-acetylglucosamine acyltransferase
VAYRQLFFGEGVLAERVNAVACGFPDDPLIKKIIAFIRAGGKRPLMRACAGRNGEEHGGDAD